MSLPKSTDWSAMFASWLESAAGPPSESEIEGLVSEILDHGSAAPEAVCRVGLRVLRRDQAIGRALGAAARRDSDGIDAVVPTPAFSAALARPLATAILRQCLITEPDMELVLTRWRRSLLLETAGGAVPIEAIVSLALQCWLNEFVFAESHEEREALAALTIKAETPEQLAILATYRALTEGQMNAAPAALIDAHIKQPAIELGLSRQIDELAAVTDATSREVRAQYEANPYPRWVSCQREQPRRLGEFLSSVSQGYGVDLPAAGPNPEILIAGCGTGQQAIQCASQFPDARITGLDLSRPSLAYAARQARRFGLGNLKWIAGDLLNPVAGWQDHFTYIECLGVLHHLASPAAGLAALVGCLKPGGLIYLGLYSATARRSIGAARELIAQERIAPDPVGIRRFRKLVYDAASRRGPKADRLRSLLGFLDFYSMSMCRDLAFHVQEHQFKPAGVAALVEGAGLELLAFGINDAALAGAYAHANPTDPMMRDATRIDAFERKNPSAFAAMYLCLARKLAK